VIYISTKSHNLRISHQTSAYYHQCDAPVWGPVG